MLIDANFDLIAFYTEKEVLPYPRYTSGGDKGTDSIYQYALPEKDAPILVIEKDIIYDDGTGLKTGFYQVTLSDDYDFLLLFESGKLKAKIPITSISHRSEAKLEKQKPKKQRNWFKTQDKFNKGKDSKEFLYRKATLNFDPPTNSYVLIYERGNIKAVGVMKK